MAIAPGQTDSGDQRCTEYTTHDGSSVATNGLESDHPYHRGVVAIGNLFHQQPSGWTPSLKLRDRLDMSEACIPRSVCRDMSRP